MAHEVTRAEAAFPNADVRKHNPPGGMEKHKEAKVLTIGGVAYPDIVTAWNDLGFDPSLLTKKALRNYQREFVSGTQTIGPDTLEQKIGMALHRASNLHE